MSTTSPVYIIEEFVKNKWYRRSDLNGDGNTGYISRDKAVQVATSNCDISRLVIKNTNEFELL